MSRLRFAMFTVLASLSTDVVRAENWCTWGPWKSHTAHNIRWPEQFLDHDRSAVRAPFQMMIANGWRSQNTIATYHFNELTGQLNDTGKLKVRAVLYDTPAEWRTVYVLRADRAELTAARMQSVQEFASELMQGDPIPQILLTTVEPRGTRGDVSDGVNRRFMENAPIPVLPPSAGEEDN